METLDTYLTGLASPSATPGGGSAAMFVAAAGAALVAMVCRICAANPKFTIHREAAERIVADADELREAFMAARKRDEDAYDQVVQAQALPRSTETEKATRAEVLEQALHHAADIPLAQASHAVRAMQLSQQALQIGNKSLVSDLGCAAEFAHAALKACAYNVRINHKYMKNQQSVAQQSQVLAGFEREGDTLLHNVRAAVNSALL